MHKLPGGGDRLFGGGVPVAIFDEEMAVVADQERPEVVPQVVHDLGTEIRFGGAGERHSSHVALDSVAAVGQLCQLRLMAIFFGVGLDLFGQRSVDGGSHLHREFVSIADLEAIFTAVQGLDADRQEILILFPVGGGDLRTGRDRIRGTRIHLGFVAGTVVKLDLCRSAAG